MTAPLDAVILLYCNLYQTDKWYPEMILIAQSLQKISAGTRQKEPCRQIKDLEMRDDPSQELDPK